MPPTTKEDVRSFWNEKSCGEVYATGSSKEDRLSKHERMRYKMEPFIFEFARFYEGVGQEVLEIGVGMGADHLHWALSGPKRLVGIDLTDRAVAFTRERIAASGLKSTLQVGDAENLPFPDASFDIVYSWGVLHHTPDTARAIREVHRVLKPGGAARIMLYHLHSLTGYMLWARYGMLSRPRLSLKETYARYLESPGTQAFTVAEVHELFRDFSKIATNIRLGPGDLLMGAAGQRHQGALLNAARRVWPRWFFRTFTQNLGLMMMIDALK